MSRARPILAALSAGLVLISSATVVAGPPANGSYIKSPAGVVCVVQDGKKQWICAEIWGPVLGNPENRLLRLSQAEFDAIPTGTPHLPDGILVRNKAGTVCATWEGKKQYVSAATRPAFDARRPVYQVPEVVFDKVPTGAEADAQLAAKFPAVPPPPPPLPPERRDK